MAATRSRPLPARQRCRLLLQVRGPGCSQASNRFHMDDNNCTHDTIFTHFFPIRKTLLHAYAEAGGIKKRGSWSEAIRGAAREFRRKHEKGLQAPIPWQAKDAPRRRKMMVMVLPGNILVHCLAKYHASQTVKVRNSYHAHVTAP